MTGRNIGGRVTRRASLQRRPRWSISTSLPPTNVASGREASYPPDNDDWAGKGGPWTRCASGSLVTARRAFGAIHTSSIVSIRHHSLPQASCIRVCRRSGIGGINVRMGEKHGRGEVEHFAFFWESLHSVTHISLSATAGSDSKRGFHDRLVIVVLGL